MLLDSSLSPRPVRKSVVIANVVVNGSLPRIHNMKRIPGPEYDLRVCLIPWDTHMFDILQKSVNGNAANA